MEINTATLEPLDSMQTVGDNATNFALSYLGDAWFELWCRQQVLSVTLTPMKAHAAVVELVRCQNQAKLMGLIFPLLNLQETQIYRRGRNAKLLSRPRHATVKDYREATALECLIGFWFSNSYEQRFYQIMNSDVAVSWLHTAINSARH